MKRRLASTWAWVACAAVPLRALAQSDVALDRYEPAPADAHLLTVADPSVAGSSRLFAGYMLSFAHSPLRVRAGGSTLGNPVEHQLVLHGLVALDIARRVRVALDVPMLLNQSGSSPNDGRVQLDSPHGQAWGDLRLSGYYAALRQAKFVPAAALGFSAWLPSGDDKAFAGAGQLRWSAEAVLGGDHGAWLWRVSIGRRHQSSDSVIATARSGWSAAAGVAYRAGPLQVGPEFFGFSATDGPGDVFAKRSTNLESLLAARLWVSPVVLSAAAGPGLAIGAGTPAYRVLFGLSFAAPELWAPRTDSNPVEATSAAQLPNPSSGATGVVSTARNAESTAHSASPIDTSSAPLREPSCADVEGSIRPASCPQDTDGDHIDDPHDACPNTQGEASEDPKSNGCPPAVTVQGEQLVLQQQVRFALGSDVILAESNEILTQLARIIHDHPEISRIAVDGHTDNIGSEPRNLALSRRRALSVVRWLVAHGIDERRLEARGFGPRQPLTSNDTETGRNQNRRVEFHIVGRTNLGEKGWTDGPVNK